MPKTDNPLQQFFRQPAIYLKLPSGGRFWPQGALAMPPSGEIPVYPMTAIDEITYRTPDALFNGEATVSVIQSCIPAIKDAWAVPNIDMDSILVAIRIASYGHEMDIGTKCPNCETESDYGLDLRMIIDRLRAPDYTQTLRQGDLTIFFKPLSYRETTESNQIQFEQQKTMQLLSDAGVEDQVKVDQLNAMMKKITEVTVKAMAQTIAEIRTSDSSTTDINHLLEFLNNCDRRVFAAIRDHILKLRETAELQPLDITCSNCQHQYKQTFTLDMANFFVSAS